MTLRQCLVTTTPGSRRSPVHVDPVELRIVKGQWTIPTEGEAQGNTKWTKAEANAKGDFSGRGFNGGYASFTYDSPTDKVVLLEASGHTLVYVNSTLHAGDPYSYGYLSIPIQLHKGQNSLLFQCGRGGLHVNLVDPPTPVSLDLRDSTTPDIHEGTGANNLLAAVVVRNATKQTQSLTLDAGGVKTNLPPLLPLTSRKVGFSVPRNNRITLRLMAGSNEMSSAELELRSRTRFQTYKRTFVSDIDGSVQYFAVNPSTSTDPNQALFLSLHGASVEALGQADAYSPKSWGYLVAATNRRPYGFDWEEVGRLDALEVLGIAKKDLKTDPTKTYLTGHSMGGHGTWSVGVHYPDKFAAIAPSAGWISFVSYAGGAAYDSTNPIQAMLQRAAADSDTLAMKYNYAHQGVFVLHGDADDNVPVEQARQMRAELAKFHHDFNWYEQPKANHWWDANDEPGADAVDYAGIWDMFAKHRLSDMTQVRNVDFTTVNPGSTAKCDWVTVAQQLKDGIASRVQLRVDPFLRRFVGTTENVRLLALDLSPLQGKGDVSLEIDGNKFKTTPNGKTIWLSNAGSGFEATKEPGPEAKNPSRYGGFKSVLNHRVVFVYGTRGSAEENAWAQAKANFDAETFWYRGNSSVDVVADRDFSAGRDKDRSVMLYGNQDTNSAWSALLSSSPVKVGSGKLTVGSRVIERSDISCYFVRPRPGSAVAVVGAVTGTGVVGMRVGDRIPLFSSGSGMPDVLILGSETLEKGVGGILGAGFFGPDWAVETGDFAWSP